MAKVCFAYSMTPAEYRALTLAELDALRWVLNEAGKKKKGR